MVGPDGRDSPSGIGVLLIWQQPHPIYLTRARVAQRIPIGARWSGTARSCSRRPSSWRRTRSGTRRRAATCWARRSSRRRRAIRRATTFNPTFELAYWAFGLETAQKWRERLGLSREPAWDRVLRGLSALPMRDGLYVNTESAPTTFTDADQRRDHPTLLGAYGFVGSPRVDREAMRRTLRSVMESWQWAETWGWDYPLVAMTATRLGEPELAMDALLMETR